MSDGVSAVEIGKLIQQVSQLEEQVRINNVKLAQMQEQINKSKGIAIGILVCVAGLSGLGGSMMNKLWSG